MKQETHPHLKTASNEPLTLSFDEPTHAYTDNENKTYTPVTSFVGSFFEPFDVNNTAARIAKRDNRLELDVLNEWNNKRDAASALGDRVHAYAEAIIAGQPIPQPYNPIEKRAFSIVDQAVQSLSTQYEFYPPEQMIFDPLFRIAGQMDLPARNKQTNALAILDWKTCESITNDSYNKHGLHPIEYILDSKQVHYQLQLSTYGWILTSPQSGYQDAHNGVEINLIHIPHIGSKPIWRPLQYDPRAINDMMETHYHRVVKPAQTQKW